MEVIPVLDLRGGRAVHARRGDRRRYRVVDGVLGTGHDPAALVTRYRDDLGCGTVYVADLDAIERARSHDASASPSADLTWCSRLAALGVALMVDAGVRDPADALRLIDAGVRHVIVGLETLSSIDTLGKLVHSCGSERIIFSLDVREGAPVAADPRLAALAPLDIARRVADGGIRALLVLDLARVGAAGGPPLATIAAVRTECPEHAVFAGGGVRGLPDLQRLAELGCAGALVGTALHEGAVGRSEVERVARYSRS